MAREMTPDEILARLREENGVRQQRSDEMAVSSDFTQRRRRRENKLDLENLLDEEISDDDLHEYVH